jgi:hypothetical protein
LLVEAGEGGGEILRRDQAEALAGVDGGDQHVAEGGSRGLATGDDVDGVAVLVGEGFELAAAGDRDDGGTGVAGLFIDAEGFFGVAGVAGDDEEVADADVVGQSVVADDLERGVAGIFEEGADEVAAGRRAAHAAEEHDRGASLEGGEGHAFGDGEGFAALGRKGFDEFVHPYGIEGFDVGAGVEVNRHLALL